MGVVLCFVLVATSMSVALNVTSSENINKKRLSYSFTFLEPGLQIIRGAGSNYTSFQMPGCMSVGKQAGAPSLPVKSVKLLLPTMTSVTGVSVTGDPVEIASLEEPVYPYQNPVPFGSAPEPFRCNTTMYTSDSLYPSSVYDGYHIGYSHGYAILDMTLNPVQYLPDKGRVFYYPEITMTLDLDFSGAVNQFFRNSPEDRAWVERLVYNPEITESYSSNVPTSGYPGGLVDPSHHYDYVIVTTTQHGLNHWATNTATPYNWSSLIQEHHQEDGFNCTLVTVQDINACSVYWNSSYYPLFNDTQAHIREFCKDAYQDWGTSYILIAGDADTIPARLMSYEYEPNIDADIYWSNLDNTFNNDHDTSWGEEGDTGFDLYSELFIGRITCNVPQDVSNWLMKSFYYADATDKDYLENAAFYGGDTTWPCQGDDSIDYSAIKGTSNWLGPNPGAHGQYPGWLGFNYGFETWNEVNPHNQYNLSVKWTAEPPNPGWQGGSDSIAIAGLKNAINNNQVTLISGVAHADATMSLDVYMGSWEANYHNTKPFFIHDYGCHCGDFDAEPYGVLGVMLFHSDTELAFACVYNTGYGWGSLEDTNSSSALQQKLFWDYLFDVTNNSGSIMNWQLGKAMAYSKDTMAPTINWTYSGAPGSWRGIIEGCLLFGDPAQRIKTMTRPPETPERPSGPMEGIVGTKYAFTIRTTDPDGDQVYYLWNWGDGNVSNWIGPFNSNESAKINHSWLDDGFYNITVKAKDTYDRETDWSDPLTVFISIVPALEIRNISGSLFKVSAVIRNNGSADATSVNWNITLDGGFILLGKKTTGRLITIPVGKEVTVSSNLILGIGATMVTVTAKVPKSSDIKEQKAFILLFFIKT